METAKYPKKIADVIASLDYAGVSYEVTTEPFIGDDTIVAITVTSAGGNTRGRARWHVSEPRPWQRRPCRTAKFMGGSTMYLRTAQLFPFRNAKSVAWRLREIAQSTY